MSSENDINVLIVDDDLKIADLLKIHVLSIGRIFCRTISSGEEALEILEQESFDVVISDLRMPGMSGQEFLGELNKLYPHILQVLFTGFGDLYSELLGLEVSYYISKPWQQSQLKIVFNGVFKEIRTKRKIAALEEQLEEQQQHNLLLKEKRQRTLNSALSMLRSIESLCAPGVERHSRRTAMLATTLAKRMGLDDQSIQKIESACILHDISLISFPVHLQNGLVSYMSDNEKKRYERHVELSASIVEKIDDFAELAEIIRCHHENVDGTGYLGIRGEVLSMEAKLIRICDYYDEEETYNKSAHGSTLAYMKMFRGTWFDETCFDEFFSMMSSLKK